MHIVITGASSGLGADLARGYARPGVRLLLFARRVGLLEAVAQDCRTAGADVEAVALDVADAAALIDVMLQQDDLCPIDLLICNAGIAAPPDAALAVRQIEVNLLAPVQAVEALIPRMLARGAGHVALVSSVAALRGLADSPAYCASKAGLRLYGESLRPLLAPSGVTVSVITPGFFTSPMSARFGGARFLEVRAADAARRVRRGLDRRAARISFPLPLVWLLRLLDLLPARLGDRLIRLSRFHIDTG